MRIALTLPQIEHPVRKQCGTCLHFQKAPLHGQGWCRNRDLRSEQERALVSRGDYRCIAMLDDDYWALNPELDARDDDVSTKLVALASAGLPGVRRPYVFAVMLSLVLMAMAVVLFSNSVLSTPVVSSPSKASLVAEAKQDFWLREDATSAIPSVIFIMAGSQLELIDSKAGEIIDPSLPIPAKWYKLRVDSSGDIGWAYSGWVERH